MIKIYDLTVNYLKEQCGVDKTPRFSYKIESDKRGDGQKSFRIRLYASKDKGAPVWDTGVVEGEQELFIKYDGEPLLPVHRYFWTVDVESVAGDAASEESTFVTGKLGERWDGKWISARYVLREGDAFGAVYLRKTFDVSKTVSEAYLSICGLGYFESSINGKKTGDDVLSPAFTEFSKTDMYLTYDVADKLNVGENVVSVVLGNGWYNCFAEDPWNTRAASWRHWPKMICELKIVYDDGSVEKVVSDTTWRGSKGPIFFNGIRNGEHYDARLELGDYKNVGYDDSAWDGTKIMKSPGGALEAMEMPPIRVQKTFSPSAIRKSENGYIVEFPQNMAGFCRYVLRGKKDTEITMRHSDMLKENGELDMQMGGMTRSHGFQTDKYIKKSDDEEKWQPIFVYHGFQYVEISGIDYEPSESDVTAVCVCTDVGNAGRFSCSDELLNKVQHLCRWSTISNMESIPTDCPHREKNGWTGDTALSCEQMLINFGAASFLSKWSEDMRSAQRPAGQIPCVVPSTGWGYYGLMGPDWSSALISVPYNIYLYEGDVDILKINYDAIKRNCDFMESMTDDLTLHYGTGDWCPPFEGPALSKNMGNYKCPVEVSDTGFFYNAAKTVVKIAKLLGKDDDAEYYSDLAARIRKTWRERFFDKETFTVKGDCQTATGVMLYFGLYEPDEYDGLINKLVEQIERTDWHLDFGVLGNKFVMHSLGAAGKNDVGYKMIAQRTFPGCQRWIDCGATTLWECWNGTGSHNHHMFSDLSAFMYKYVGGISPDEDAPGFKHIVFRPAIGAELESAMSVHESMYGEVKCYFSKRDGQTTINVKVPFGCTATLYLPDGFAGRVKEDGRAVEETYSCGVQAGAGGKEFFIELSSGEYSFCG
ncbi:MAG: family 78 glycoside hydrolase catalytic domain [Clostridia bacterium]|nr:family 78 glycoside hydrolase catalytic domain [Clostridia bacterium]